MESSRRLPFAKELWIIVLRVCHARRARDGAGIHSTCRRGQGLSQAKSHGWPRQVHAAGKVDPFPSHQEPKECSEQQQYKAVWHVKPAQNDGQAGLPVAEAGRKRGQDKCGARPIPEDEDAAPPRREDIATSGWVRLQVFSHGLPEAQRSNGVRLDFVPPFFGYIRLEAGCLRVRQCVRCMLLRRRTRLVPFRVSISFWSCHGCRAGYGTQLLARCLREDPTMWTRWQGGFHTTMKKQANPLYAGQGWLSSVKAACLLVVE
ncbi:hypothetical protein TcCL_Unassigned01690 [Trypanosoma cruzi]|nr:hypothetical protein TcCL_Unassigned01690 [Trypanosoma cruzi]